MSSPAASRTGVMPFIALTGNPNCGKTTLFNALTGLRAKVGNYAGVTVERKEGRLRGVEVEITILDLPGTYSLSPKSLDEQVSRDVLFRRVPEVPALAAVVIVVDASNLERNLYYATQVIELGYPTILALNMVDVAEANGHAIDAAKLSAELGVPVVPLVASEGRGLPELRDKLVEITTRSPRTMRQNFFATLPKPLADEVNQVAALLSTDALAASARAEALLLLSDDRAIASSQGIYAKEVITTVSQARPRLEISGIDWRSAAIEARYARVAAITGACVTETAVMGETFSDKLDRVITHKVWGTIIFILIMALMFQSIFTFAKVPMDFLSGLADAFGGWVGTRLPPGLLNDLLVNGVVKGVSAVVVFLPQILLLFVFISLLEDTGYMSRAAFLMDRLMSKVGLHGKSFIPMLSSFACAIPGIMATRTIETPKDRLVTIMVAPLMSCSARLPVYAVLIAACVPDRKVLGFIGLPGLTLLSMYLLGIVMALLMAWVFKKTLLKGATPMLIMELPPYKRPVLTTTLRHMWDRSKLFLRRAGTVILGINILLWFLATYPRSTEIVDGFAAKRAAAVKEIFPETKAGSVEEQIATLKEKFAKPQVSTNANEAALLEKVDTLDKEEQGEKLRHSFAGRMGHAIEPAIAPLGFDWKMGIGIVASFAAREVFVSTMSVVYNVGETDTGDEASTSGLAKVLAEQKRSDGTPVYTTLVALSLMVFYVIALQCVSTIAVVRRETNSWKWPALQWAYMAVLAWVMAFITYQGGRLLGFS